jgi:uncharacterized protein DUF5996
VRHVAPLDPSDRQVAPIADAPDQPLVECAALRHLAGAHDIPIPHGTRTFEVLFDFVEHQLRIETSDGATERITLRPMSVAEFYAEVMARLAGLGIEAHIWTMPNEIENAIPFEAPMQARPTGGKLGQARRSSADLSGREQLPALSRA